MDPWETARPTGICASTGRPLEPGQTYYAVLFEDGESFRRADYAPEAWTGPPQDAFCFFKTRVPQREPKKKRLLVDDELLVNFFVRLEDETELLRQHFRFVLALILMRKRILRYEETIRDDGAEYWQMRLVKEQALHRVLNPHLTDDQIEAVSQQLGAILHGDFAAAPLDDDSDLLADASASESGGADA
ncbi:MAG: hypothetical protein ACE5GE_06680 [Phycisphaerae bacterium]